MPLSGNLETTSYSPQVTRLSRKMAIHKPGLNGVTSGEDEKFNQALHGNIPPGSAFGPCPVLVLIGMLSGRLQFHHLTWPSS